MTDATFRPEARSLLFADLTEFAEPPLTEPVVVPCLYCTGAGVARAPHAVQLVFWVHSPGPGLGDEERRLTVRVALPIDATRVLARSLNRELKDMGN